MACQMGSIVMQSRLSFMENECPEKSSINLATSRIQNWSSEPSFSGCTLKVGTNFPLFVHTCFLERRAGWKIAFALNTGEVSGNGEQESLNNASSSFGGTRLGRILTTAGRQLLEKLNSARKNFPMKLFLLLLGFFTANALATILGQTGDWDVLVAAIVVAVIEGIGMIMYKKSPVLAIGRLQSFVTMMNYWKAGVCLGIFVDGFKVGS